jgi:hypothetical protein
MQGKITDQLKDMEMKCGVIDEPHFPPAKREPVI